MQNIKGSKGEEIVSINCHQLISSQKLQKDALNQECDDCKKEEA